MKLLILSVVLLGCTTSFASVSVSKEYPFLPKLVSDLEKDLAKAASRNPELQEYPIAYTIGDANGIVLWCPPHQPVSDGTGCSLNFLIKMDSVTLNIKKGVAMSFTAQQVNDQLSKLDPNTTQDHQQFGSPFEKKDTFGSHYYCQPEGNEKAKTWQCYLYVQESFGG